MFQNVTVHYYGRRALVSNPVHVVSIIYDYIGIHFPITLVPNITTKIRDNKNPVVGQSGYSLICEVFGADSLSPIITYVWTKSNGTDFEMQIGNNSTTLTLHPLRHSDAGLYTCHVDINSNYLNGAIFFNTSWNVSIQSKLNLMHREVGTVHLKIIVTHVSPWMVYPWK